MISGTYWEYICPKCFWFPSIIIPAGQDEAVKKQLELKVAEHNEKYHALLPDPAKQKT